MDPLLCLILALFGSLTLLVILAFIWANLRHRHQAPGPLAFPVLGHIPYCLFTATRTEGPHSVFTRWSRTNGWPIMELQLGTKRAIIISDLRLLREAFSTPALCDRPNFPANLIRSGTDGVQRGIIFAQGAKWSEQRRFALRHLRDFGFGTRKMEGIILDEALELVQGFKKDADEGVPISTELRFNIAVVNVLWAIVAGERFEHDDPKLRRLVANVTQNLAEAGANGVIAFMPTFAQAFPNISGWKKYLDSFYETNNFIRDCVKAKRARHRQDPTNPALNDFMDVYIDQISRTTDKESGFFDTEGENNLATVVDDLFTAGSETTSTTMTWLLMLLAMHPAVQEEVYAEIEGVIGAGAGAGRLPSLSDRPSMPFTEAVLMETLRVSSVVPASVPHYCYEDTMFHGYLIPKNSLVFGNVYAVHHDPNIWGDPQNFRPERFLSADRGTVVKHEALLAFSTGKRVCIGESLARDELFLFITTLLQKFVIGPDPAATAKEALNMKQYVRGIVAQPSPHKIVLKNRT